MAGRPKSADVTQCRQCKQREPIVKLVTIRGEPQGECKPCRANRQLRLRAERNASQALYRSRPDLVSDNLKILSTLPNGVYCLAKQCDQSQVGYIITQKDSIFVYCYNLADLFTYELFGVASFLANLNVLIAPSRGTDGLEPIDAESLAGLKPRDVQERLIWYDKALISKAGKLLKDEARAIRAANMAIARTFRVQNTPSETGDASD